MEYNTLEIIGLAFLSGIKISEIAEEVIEEDNEEKENAENEEIKTGVIKLDGEKAKEFINFVENNLIKKNKEDK